MVTLALADIELEPDAFAATTSLRVVRLANCGSHAPSIAASLRQRGVAVELTSKREQIRLKGPTTTDSVSHLVALDEPPSPCWARAWCSLSLWPSLPNPNLTSPLPAPTRPQSSEPG